MVLTMQNRRLWPSNSPEAGEVWCMKLETKCLDDKQPRGIQKRWY
jgi:hypothetical protein